ncbi:MAG: urea ABC transporter permease subunit UrtB [Steroidobacteraceae bacterium]
MPGHPGASTIIAVPAAFLVSGLVGVLIERGVVRFLYGRPLETLLATFGVSLILQQVARDVFSANNRPVESPSWMSGLWQINGALSITYNRLVIVLFTFVVFAALLMVLKRTRLGLEVRAVAQNRAMARAMGIRSQWVDAMTFGLGSGIAGIAGVALSQLTNVGPNLGQSYIVDSFMVVVFGGVGNLWGTMIGGMSLGIVNKLLEPYAGAGAGQDICADRRDPVHSAPAPRALPAEGPGGGGLMVNAPLRPMLLFRGVDRNGKTFLLVLATLAILVLLLNAAVPASPRCTSPPTLSASWASTCAMPCWLWRWISSGAIAAS